MPTMNGRKLLRRHDDHRLVEERKTLANATCLYQHVTLCVQRHREEVAIPEAFPDCSRLARDRSSLCEVSGCLMLEDEGDQQKSVFRGLLGPRLEEALRAAEPPCCRPDDPSVREGHPDPRRRPGCTQRLATLRVEVMCPLEGRDRLVIAREHQQRHRQKLEIFGRERLGLVCLGERLVRGEPGGLRVRGAGTLEVGLERAHLASSCNRMGTMGPSARSVGPYRWVQARETHSRRKEAQ